jgi:hypothetical protein
MMDMVRYKGKDADLKSQEPEAGIMSFLYESSS